MQPLGRGTPPLCEWMSPYVGEAGGLLSIMSTRSTKNVMCGEQ